MKTVGLDEQTHKKLKLFCAAEGLTMSQAVELLLLEIKKDGRVVDLVPREKNKPVRPD